MRVYPTRLAIGFAAAGALPALAAALAAPRLWSAAAAWVLLTAGLMLADLLLAAPPSRLRLTARPPVALGLSRPADLPIELAFEGPGPRSAEVAVGVNERLAADPPRQRVRLEGGRAAATVRLDPVRRGEGRIEGLWARWRGPLGLVWLQRTEADPRPIPITPDIQRVKDQAFQLFSRDALFGLRAQMETGEGGDFHALTDFQTGMDLRAIDWKQSGRHNKLVAREFRTERNHHVIVAIDSGRLMSAPAPRGSRLDQAIDAGLLLAFASLKLGDRVGLFAFDAHPRVSSGVVAGAQAFPLIQRLAAAIDYSSEETNFTLGLTTLAGRLDRRALVVVFTDFADPTSAELMIENVGRLMKTHLVLFVVFRDEELEALAEAEPVEPDDVSRAVIAAGLSRQREIVIGRLQRLGARLVDAPSRAGTDDLGLALIDAYLDVKRRDLI
ncbi:DUF58 domain-containing protein [Phenylobacterium sp.]|uniref:DUF58 domain-containing protein n=1 Tax=Phenylobacterium sp. TaxID=1871053 RepID=UPI002F3E9E18